MAAQDNNKYTIGTGIGMVHVKDAVDQGWSNATSVNMTVGNVPIRTLSKCGDGHIAGGYDNDSPAVWLAFLQGLDGLLECSAWSNRSYRIT